VSPSSSPKAVSSKSPVKGAVLPVRRGSLRLAASMEHVESQWLLEHARRFQRQRSQDTAEENTRRPQS
jgi:hypothetical protein